MDKLKLKLIKIIVSDSPDTKNVSGLSGLLKNEMFLYEEKLGDYKDED